MCPAETFTGTNAPPVPTITDVHYLDNALKHHFNDIGDGKGAPPGTILVTSDFFAAPVWHVHDTGMTGNWYIEELNEPGSLASGDQALAWLKNKTLRLHAMAKVFGFGNFGFQKLESSAAVGDGVAQPALSEKAMEDGADMQDAMMELSPIRHFSYIVVGNPPPGLVDATQNPLDSTRAAVAPMASMFMGAQLPMAHVMLSGIDLEGQDYGTRVPLAIKAAMMRNSINATGPPRETEVRGKASFGQKLKGAFVALTGHILWTSMALDSAGVAILYSRMLDGDAKARLPYV
jgi:hypothetical protein